MRGSAKAAALFIALVVGALGLWLAPAAEAICIGPNVEVAPDQALRGSTITVTGGFYWSHCNDVVICTVYTPTPTPGDPSPSPSPSPTSTCDEGEPPRPLKGIRIEFVQGGRVWDLGMVDADHEGNIRLEADVPRQANFGDASIRACTSGSECTYPTAKLRVVGVLSSELAKTGSNVTGLVTAGLIVLIVGLMVVGLVRSSRRALRGS